MRSCTTSPTSHGTTFELAWPSPRIVSGASQAFLREAALRPERLASLCRAGRSFPDSVHIRQVGLREADDTVIWEYASRHGFSHELSRRAPAKNHMASAR